MTARSTKLIFLKKFGVATIASLVISACAPTVNTDTDTDVKVEQTQIEQVATQTDLPSSSTPTTAPSQTTISAQDNGLNNDLDNANSQVNNTTETIAQPITILALGDSLTEGLGVDQANNYPAQLQTALKEAGYVNATVINSGLSGETSSGLVNRLDWVLKTDPDITILTTGANDAMRGIDVATVESNIREAIERLQAEGSVVILGGMQIYDNMGDAYVQEFTSIYPKIAEDTGVVFIPFFLEGVAGDANLNQADAIHPTSEGYTIIVNDNILPVLEPTLESMVDNEGVTE